MRTKADEIVWRLLTCVGVSRWCGCCWWLWWLVDVTVTKISLWHLETPVLQWSWRPHTNWLIYHYKHQHAQGNFFNQTNLCSVHSSLHTFCSIMILRSITVLLPMIHRTDFETKIFFIFYSCWRVGKYLVDKIKRFSMETGSVSQHPDSIGKPVGWCWWMFHPDCWTLN